MKIKVNLLSLTSFKTTEKFRSDKSYLIKKLVDLCESGCYNLCLVL